MGFTATLEYLLVLLGTLVFVQTINSVIFVGLPLLAVRLVYLNFEMYKISKPKERRLVSSTSIDNGRLKTK